MSSKIGLNLTKRYSINFSLPKRKPKTIKFIILHYTGMKKETEAINRLTSPKSKVSCHYFIKNNGETFVMVICIDPNSDIGFALIALKVSIHMVNCSSF